MSLFKRPPIVDSEGYERKAIQGYADRGKVARMLAEGWEVETSNPVMMGAVTLNQRHFLLRRKVVSGASAG